jgi:hypothetical protein
MQSVIFLFKVHMWVKRNIRWKVDEMIKKYPNFREVTFGLGWCEYE